MTAVEQRLEALGLELPAPARPSFNYLPVVVHGDLVFVSGQLPKEDGEVRITGRVGEEINLEEARRAARISVLQGIAVAADALGGVEHIVRVLRMTGFVASAPDFHDQPKVVDAASDLLVDLFSENGRHARSAVGVAELPRDAPVELEFILSTR
jgi:enamine deaminase RidA (YjgF/YER057c/UK114 family)